MNKSKSTIIWGSVIVLLLLVLLIYPRFAAKQGVGGGWESLQVLCLPNGHVNLAQHIHPTLEIVVDGVREPIPTNIGVSQNCMMELHTHDDTGTIHIETVDPYKSFTLGNFFKVWKKDFVRVGFEAVVTSLGVPISDPLGLALKDHQKVVITYTKIN